MESTKMLMEILERVARVETKIDTYNNYREKTETALSKSKQNERDIAEIKDNLKWLWRTFAGALIVGFIAYFVKWGN